MTKIFLTGKQVFFIIFFLAVLSAEAQDFTNSFAEKQYKITKTGMFTLGGWSLGNIVVNAALLSGPKNSTRYFHEMNIYWNLVNLAIAGGGYWANQKSRGKARSVYGILERQHKIEKSLLFNAGLDVAYMAAGQLLRERAKHVSGNSQRLEGFGNGLILQGAFLFTFDVLLHAVHVSHRKKNKKDLEQIKLVFNSGGIRMYF